MKTNGEKINVFRKLNNLTQAELGAALNVTSQAVSKWERDESEPDFATLSKMCKLFNITLDDFVNENFALVETEAEEDTKNNAEQIGFCTSCGVAVKEDNLGERSPKILCSSCRDLKLEALKADANKKKEEEDKKEAAVRTEKAMDKASIIWRCVFSGIVAIICLVALIISTSKEIDMVATIFFDVLVSIWLFTFVYQLCTFESIPRRALSWFSWIIFRMPGIIFELSLDGIVWLLTVKLAMWILSLLLGAVAFVLGLIASFIVSLFTFPFVFVEEIKEAK